MKAKSGVSKYVQTKKHWLFQDGATVGKKKQNQQFLVG